MAIWHGYIGIENIALGPAAKQALIDELRTLGILNDAQPARRCHWRTRLDGDAVIFEAAFDQDALTVKRWKQRLGVIFGVDWTTISAVVGSATFAALASPVVVFSRGGTDYLRVAVFGGIEATWAQSRIEALGYLAINAVEWEEESMEEFTDNANIFTRFTNWVGNQIDRLRRIA